MKHASRFPGWSVVWVAFTVALFAWGIGFYGPGVFLQTLHATRGWSIATVSAAITAHFLIGAAIVVGLPEIYRAFGVANATILGALLSALGIVAWASATTPWHLFAAAVISGGGWALTSGAAVNAIIAPWFDRDRPKALSHALNGASVGGIVFVPLMVWSIARIDFQPTAIVAGLAMAIVVTPLAHRYLRQTPADLGLPPDGKTPAVDARPAGDAKRQSRASVIKSRQFVTVSAAFALALFAQIGLLAHLLARLTPELGLNGAAAAVSLTTLSAIAGRTLLGWLIGDHDRRVAACVNFLTQSVGVALLCTQGTPLTLLLGCSLFGLGVGNAITLPALIVQKEFRPADVGMVVALVVAINQAVFALAPAVLGSLREFTESYVLAFATIAVLQVVAAFIVLLGKR